MIRYGTCELWMKEIIEAVWQIRNVLIRIQILFFNWFESRIKFWQMFVLQIMNTRQNLKVNLKLKFKQKSYDTGTVCGCKLGTYCM